MTEIYRGITIEGQKALDKFSDIMFDDIDRVMNNIINSISESTWNIEDMDHHTFYLKATLLYNVVQNIITPIINGYESKKVKND
jgi:hypothetical protein